MPAGKGFRLWVAIADVSHYVRHGDALDLDARARGNSVYFPRRVIPMLPEKLSNGLCSLNPEVDRLCMVCEMVVDPRGEIKDYQFYPAVIHSHARLTYTAVAAALAGERGRGAAPALLPHLQDLHRLYQVLAKARARRGAIDFETVETRMEFDEQGKIERIVPVERNDAHRLIEECMLAANVCASDFLQTHEHPTLYRIHEGPTPEKLAALREFLREFGLQLGGGDEPHAKDYAKLLESIRGRPDSQLLQTVLLRSLQQAVYSPENVGHFGLAYEAYTHFTSPIRRYPDLLVHRAIKAVLAGATYEPGNWASWASIARRPSGAPTRPRATSRPGSSATTCTTASAKSSAAASAASPPSACSWRWTRSTSRAWCTSPSWATTTSSSTPPATSCWASARASASGWATACGCGWCGPISRPPGWISCWPNPTSLQRLT